LNTVKIIRYINAELLINNKKTINLIEKPSRGGTPAKDRMIIKKNKLNGKTVPNFFKSLKFFINRVSKVLSNKKKVNNNNIYTDNTNKIAR
jgi:hypothetical protein